MSITIAFDIETSGCHYNKHSVIGLGMAAVDNNFAVLETLFIPGYIPNVTVFEDRCWNEFWIRHPDELETLECDHKSTEEAELEIVTRFMQFRRKWEQIAVDRGLKCELVSDNNVFDGGRMNHLICKLLPDQMPLPYSALTGKYSSYWETHSEQRGLLMSVAPENAVKQWGYSVAINKLYEVPACPVVHDHRPDNDALTIAWEHTVLLAIRDKKLKLRTV